MRTLSTHLAASIAASGLKWISATIGTSQPRSRKPFTILSRLRESFTVGAVMRTISQPTFANSIVCWIDISVSIVSHVIIDWTRIGLVPPIPILPTRTSRERRRLNENGDSQYFTTANLKAPRYRRNPFRARPDLWLATGERIYRGRVSRRANPGHRKS